MSGWEEGTFSKLSSFLLSIHQWPKSFDRRIFDFHLKSKSPGRLLVPLPYFQKLLHRDLSPPVRRFLKNSVGENEMLHYQFYPIYTLGHRQISLIRPRLIFQKLKTFALANPMK